MRLDKGLRLLFIPAALAALLGAFNADDKMLRKASEAINGSAYRAHPANDVFGVVAAAINAEAGAVPRGRFAMLRRSGMSLMVRFSPNRKFE